MQKLESKVTAYEFFINGKGRNLVVNDLTNDTFKIFESSDKFIINLVLNKVEEDYPEAYQRLKILYWNGRDRKYMMAARFLRCNFSKNDKNPDVDECGNLCLEHVDCPLRGLFCKDEGIICQPKLNTKLSSREREIALLYADGATLDEIGEQLFISRHTVKNHKQRGFKKLNINSQSELVNWAHKNNLL